jgi:hypothetical protein
MSLVHSYSVDSTSSTATIATLPFQNDLANNSSNGLYEDRNHFQAIFSNDSRFFDTSLHLFKSYCTLGYIQSKEEKSRKLHVPFISTTSFRGHKHRWRPQLFTSKSTNEHENRILKAFLTPTLLRKSSNLFSKKIVLKYFFLSRIDYSTSNQSDSGISTTEPRKSPMVAHYQPLPVPIITLTDDNEADVIITRL